MGGVDGCTAKRRETVARDRIRRCGCQEAVEVLAHPLGLLEKKKTVYLNTLSLSRSFASPYPRVHFRI